MAQHALSNDDRYLTRDMFEQHKQHLDDRLDKIDRRFDVIERIIRDGALHDHPRYVTWGGLMTSLIAIGTGIAALAIAIIEKVGG